MIKVILCAYNGEKYIGRQIDSIMNQTADLQLHIFDDASTDGTAEIAKKYEAAYPGKVFVTIRPEGTGGACMNFLTALSGTQGADYYMFSDQDDIWDSNKAERLLTEMKKCEEIQLKTRGVKLPTIAYSDGRLVEDNPDEQNPISDIKECAAGTDHMRRISDSFVKYQKLHPKRTKFNHLLIQNQVTGAAMMINEELRNIVCSKPVAQNAVMHDHYIAILAAAFGEIVYIDETLYDYVQHGDNTLGSKKGSFAGETAERLGLGDKSRAEADKKSKAAYTGVFRQAMEIRELYGDELDKDKLEALTAFISIPKMDRISKIRTILKYDFRFDTLYRTIGEFIFI